MYSLSHKRIKPNSKCPQVAFTGGGTGGHIYPCLAVAELIWNKRQRFINSENITAQNPENLKSSRVYYIGGEDKLEAELCKRKEYIDFLPINAPKLPSLRGNLVEKFRWLETFSKACTLSINYIKEKDINIVMGTGGYIAAPVFLACLITRTPFLVHNLDSNFGLVNKLFSIFARHVTLGFPIKEVMENEILQPERSSPRNKKFHYTGNPVSYSFIKIYEDIITEGKHSNRIDNRVKPSLNILVSGGSQGSQFINDLIGSLLMDISELNSHDTNLQIFITHVTGSKLFNEHIQKYLEGNINKYPFYKVLDYTHEMPELCKEADLAICRSGAMTCAEMIMSQTIPIFIPLPWAANDHQTKNAETIVSSGCGFMIKQDSTQSLESQGAEVKKIILDLLQHPEKTSGIKQKLIDLAKPNSSEEILSLIEQISK